MSVTQSLFNNQLPPLAERIRPKTLNQFVGQERLIGEGKVLSGLMNQEQSISIIFWGPPGSGKTTLARIIAQNTNADLHQLSAVSSGVKELREIIKIGKKNIELGQRTILFIDEIHRFNRSQQDSLLHAVESGTLILIGATTENPSFEIISPLLSRCKVLVLSQLSLDELICILDHAMKEDIVLGKGQIVVPKNIREKMARSAGGDARKMLNTLEVTINLMSNEGTVTETILSEALQNRTQIYDKKGDYHYDSISAFIKSVRGSDPDAAIYWLAIMVEGGEKPEFIARRLIILASEDIGNADPQSLSLAVSGFNAVHIVGYPEALIILGQVTTYLSLAPKSNASYKAISSAIERVKKDGTPGVPLHLRNASTELMRTLKYGKEYDYPHDNSNHFVKENYFPDGVSATFYHPTNQGYEHFLLKRIKDIWPERQK